MDVGSENPSVTVYAPSRWASRTFFSCFLAVGVVGFAASGVVLPLIAFGALACLMLFAGERAAVEVSSQGVRLVPPFGRARSYPWSDIDGFVARRIGGGYGAWVVSMKVKDDWVDLTATRRGALIGRSRRAVEQQAEEMNAELRARQSR
jgi:Bacterial PH domain